MNVERILALADLIEVQPHTETSDTEGFNMASYYHPCGTPSCIAGWAAWKSVGDEAACICKSARDAAQAYLGLTVEQANKLFYMQNSSLPYESITPAHAAKTLRHLAATGEVKW